MTKCVTTMLRCRWVRANSCAIIDNDRFCIELALVVAGTLVLLSAFQSTSSKVMVRYGSVRRRLHTANRPGIAHVVALCNSCEPAYILWRPFCNPVYAVHMLNFSSMTHGRPKMRIVRQRPPVWLCMMIGCIDAGLKRPHSATGNTGSEVQGTAQPVYVFKVLAFKFCAIDDAVRDDMSV